MRRDTMNVGQRMIPDWKGASWPETELLQCLLVRRQIEQVFCIPKWPASVCAHDKEYEQNNSDEFKFHSYLLLVSFIIFD